MKITDSLTVNKEENGINYVSGEEDSIFFYAKYDKDLTQKTVKIYLPNKNAILIVDKAYDKMECGILSSDRTSCIFTIDITKTEQVGKDLDSWYYYKWLECPCNGEEDDERPELICLTLKK